MQFFCRYKYGKLLGTDIKYFQVAAEGHKVRFYVHECHKINDYKIGVCNVVACCYSILCVKADAMVIAVTQQLQMRDSGVGTVLAIAGIVNFISRN